MKNLVAVLVAAAFAISTPTFAHQSEDEHSHKSQAVLVGGIWTLGVLGITGQPANVPGGVTIRWGALQAGSDKPALARLDMAMEAYASKDVGVFSVTYSAPEVLGMEFGGRFYKSMDLRAGLNASAFFDDAWNAYVSVGGGSITQVNGVSFVIPRIWYGTGRDGKFLRLSLGFSMAEME